MNPLLIIGGGAAGLMAAATAAELHIPALLLERRHRPGLKLLLCGNNRCNISHDATANEMLQDYGDPVGPFLQTAIRAFPPESLRQWFGRAGLPTIVKRERIYPKSENADDVLHCLLDLLREAQLPYVLNCPVQSISPQAGSFLVTTEKGVEFQAANLLLAVGGFSYPKTGSVGDGQHFASALHHAYISPEPGLAGIDCPDPLLATDHEMDLPDVAISLLVDGKPHSRVRGNLLCCGSVLRGSVIFDTTRIIARIRPKSFSLLLDFCPGMATPPQNLGRLPLPGILLPRLNRLSSRDLKAYPLACQAIRPLKEAIVSVGGIALDEINPDSMESRLHPGLFFAGEVMDIDGPTGGYNLHAAFATARLAITSIAKRLKGQPTAKSTSQRKPSSPTAPQKTHPGQGTRQSPAPRPQSPRERYGDPRTTSRGWR